MPFCVLFTLLFCVLFALLFANLGRPIVQNACRLGGVTWRCGGFG
ncbi:hypothetical protein [Gordonibacter sp.]|nr:hypothetical protein [Gordonibacter sp.]